MKAFVVVMESRNSDDDVKVFMNANDAVLFAIRTALEWGDDWLLEDLEESNDNFFTYDKEDELAIMWHFEGYYMRVFEKEVE